MANRTEYAFLSDYAVPPGETLQETLDELSMSQAELARRIGRTPKMVNEIIAGKAPITPETALLLEQVLGVPARLWNNLERRYQEDLARISERETLKDHVSWLKELPLREMIAANWVPERDDEIEQLRAVLRFFGVATPVEWRALWLEPQAAFRQSTAFEADPIAVAAWLRKGELDAQRVPCAPYEKSKFRNALKEIRTLTTAPPAVFQRQMMDLCASAGVALVFVPAISRTRASGVTRWLSPEKALIQLSLRYKADDQLWFTLFHEAGHIYLHGKRDIFIEGEETEASEKENEADRFAADMLIPRTVWSQFRSQPRQHYSRDDIYAFARSIGIAPGIVAGRLQHEDEEVPYSHFNDLKRRLDWRMEDGTALVVEKGR
jgi:HTH-type transcriptional regulator / antitoxin HigA